MYPQHQHNPSTLVGPRRFAEHLISSFLKVAGQIVREGDELYVLCACTETSNEFSAHSITFHRGQTLDRADATAGAHAQDQADAVSWRVGIDRSIDREA